MTTLSSEWGGKSGLSKHLLATFFQVDRKGASLGDTNVVVALTDANMEVALNWQSPFENTGAENKAPALMAMLQSGALTQTFEAGKALLGFGNPAEDIAKQNSFLQSLEGKSGITKLNSTQVFTGMPPVKITVTALLRAWKSPRSEVDAPYNQLMNWALSPEISESGTIVERTANRIAGEGSVIDILMPSATPVMIGMRYKGRTYKPLVIESIGMPMNSPVDANGDYVELHFPMTLCTLSALDRSDWANTQK